MRSEILTGIIELIAELEAAGPEGLDGMRRRFRDLGRTDSGTAMTQLLEARFELLVASRLARVGALRRIRADTPDFDCHWNGSDLGVEATTRAREEIGSALERAMERGQWGDADVHVTLTRTGKLLFSEPPELIAKVSDRVIRQIRAAIAAAGDRTLEHGNIPIPEFGLNAAWTTGTGIGFPGARFPTSRRWSSPRRSGSTTGRWLRGRSRTRWRTRARRGTSHRALQ